MACRNDGVDMSREQDTIKDSGGRGSSRSQGKHDLGNGNRGQMHRSTAVSKALSKLLRHAAEDAGFKLDHEGFARLDQVMKWPRLKSLAVTYADIRTAVNDSSKQRYSMKPNPTLPTPPDPASIEPSDWVIRANQGHSIASIDSAGLLAPITVEAGNVPETVVHGTFFAFYEPIFIAGGLKTMGRNHIHFSTGLPEDGVGGVISGMRRDAEVLIYIDIAASLDDGFSWWLSENGVVLTAGDTNGLLPFKYFQKVVGRRDGVGLLMDGGVEVAKLPLALRDRKPPAGKEQNRGGRNVRGQAKPAESR